MPPAWREKHPELAEIPEDVAVRQMRETVTAHFEGHAGTDLHYESTDGSPVVELLQRTRRHDIDLVVVGKAVDKRDAGSVPEKLARKAPCSIMVVRQNSAPKITRILLPLDFSEPSAGALEVAAAFARVVGNAPILPLHAYHVPVGFASVGRTYDQFADIMREHAEEQYREFLARANLEGLELHPAFVPDELPSNAIDKAVQSRGADLVIMGARGRSDAAAILLGSATERVVRRAKVPVLVVRRKGEGMGVLDALLSW
jgi:nucleotide-binding universal stress UspA family protein